MATEHAIRDCLISPNVPDSNMEPANVVDVIAGAGHNISRAAKMIAAAITPTDAAPSQDACGGYVSSLTEATMGVTRGLCEVAAAINNLADAVRETKQ